MKVGDLVTTSHWDGLVGVVVDVRSKRPNGIATVLITNDDSSFEINQLVADLEVING